MWNTWFAKKDDEYTGITYSVTKKWLDGGRNLRKLFQKFISKDPVIIKHGFQKAGIYPFCNAVIPIESYEPQVYRRWCNFKENLADRTAFTNIVTDEAITVAPVTTTIVEVNPQTPAIVRIHVEENPPGPTSRVNVGEVSTPSSPKEKRFEELLLEHIKQTPPEEKESAKVLK